MKKILLSLAIFSFLYAGAQDETVKQLQKEADKSIKKDADTAQSYWKKGGMFNVNISQGSLSNWAAGGDDFSLSLHLLVFQSQQM